MEMGHTMQQHLMPEGVAKKHLRDGNITAWLWIEQLCSSMEDKIKYITFQEKEKIDATRTEGIKSHTLRKGLVW